MFRYLLLAISLLGLTGISYAEDKPNGKYDEAVLAGKVISFSDLGASQIKSVYVPARYSINKQGSLYLNGNRWFAPGGAGEVEAFITTQTGYLVAVKQSGSPTMINKPQTIDPKMFEGMTAEQKLRALELMQKMSGNGAQVQSSAGMDGNSKQVVFYNVGADGSVAGVLGSLPYSSQQAAVTGDAIYIPQPARGPANLTVWNYVGISASGAQVSGPQGVLFAAPLADGGWFSQEIIQADTNRSLIAAGAKVALVKTSADGTRNQLAQTTNDYRGIDTFTSTTAIYVNTPTLSDSVRTGYAIRMYREANSWNSSTDFNSVMGAAYNLNNPPPTTKRGAVFLGDFTVNFGDVHSGGAGMMLTMSQRMALLGTPTNPILVSQLPSNKFKKSSYPDLSGLYIGYVNLNGLDSESVPMYNIFGGGMDFARKILGSNNGELSLHALNDVFAVITPKSQFVLLADKLKKGDYPGYVPASNNVLSSEEAKTFASKYGLSLQ